MATLNAIQQRYVLEKVEELRSAHPGLTIDGLVDLLKASVDASESREGDAIDVERGECRRCGDTIVRLGGNRWTHSVGKVGCRAASFDPGLGWDESLDPKWKASPAR